MFMEDYRDPKKLRQNLGDKYPLDSPLCSVVIRHGKQFYCCHVGRSTIFKQINVIGMLWGRQIKSCSSCFHETRTLCSVSYPPRSPSNLCHKCLFAQRKAVALFLGYVPRSPRALFETQTGLEQREAENRYVEEKELFSNNYLHVLVKEYFLPSSRRLTSARNSQSLSVFLPSVER